jgi:hypothetical protein
MAGGRSIISLFFNVLAALKMMLRRVRLLGLRLVLPLMLNVT